MISNNGSPMLTEDGPKAMGAASEVTDDAA